MGNFYKFDLQNLLFQLIFEYDFFQNKAFDLKKVNVLLASFSTFMRPVLVGITMSTAMIKPQSGVIWLDPQSYTLEC